MNIRALVAEAVGTFILVGVGSMAIFSALLVGGGQGTFVILIVPFGFGLGLMAAIAVGGHASGGHYNPAVTLAALFDGRVTPLSAVGYVIAQILGGLVASLVLRLIASVEVVGATVNQPGSLGGNAELAAFSVEVILTAIFVAVILTVTRKEPNLGIVVIPLTLVAIHFAAIPISGASVNPVRSLAPAVVSGTYASLWVYLTGPFAGSIVGWALYRFLTPPDDEVSVEVEEDFDDDLDELDEAEDEDR